MTFHIDAPCFNLNLRNFTTGIKFRALRKVENNSTLRQTVFCAKGIIGVCLLTKTNKLKIDCLA